MTILLCVQCFDLLLIRLLIYNKSAAKLKMNFLFLKREISIRNYINDCRWYRKYVLIDRIILQRKYEGTCLFGTASNCTNSWSLCCEVSMLATLFVYTVSFHKLDFIIFLVNSLNYNNSYMLIIWSTSKMD